MYRARSALVVLPKQIRVAAGPVAGVRLLLLSTGTLTCGHCGGGGTATVYASNTITRAAAVNLNKRTYQMVFVKLIGYRTRLAHTLSAELNRTFEHTTLPNCAS